MADKLVLVDGNSLAVSSYFGIPKLSTKSGIPTNAVYGFISSIFKLMDDFPTHFGVVFDKGHSHRKAASSTYKSHRRPMDEELRTQLPIIKEFLDVLRIPHFAKQGYEGDDILSIFTHKFCGILPIYVATRDRDLFQLCQYKDTYVIFTHMTKGKASTQVVDATKVKELMGITPEQIVYYKALAGDQSDEIPGVRGVGNKTAIKLIQEHNDLDTIVTLAKNNNLKPPRLNKLIMDDIINLVASFKLGSLLVEDTFVELDNLKRVPSNENEVTKFFEKYEFNSFLGK
jgi:DNA polymerase-1